MRLEKAWPFPKVTKKRHNIQFKRWFDEHYVLKKYIMSTIQSLAHSKWDCKYHVVFIPKRRRKTIFISKRKDIGKIFHELARQKECTILEGSTLSDHVHMCISIPPKHSVASVIGFIKGKTAIAMARMNGKHRNFQGESFWARGYWVSTVGYDLEKVKKYIREQKED